MKDLLVVSSAILALGFFAHLLVGNRESMSTRPAAERDERASQWAHSICAVQDETPWGLVFGRRVAYNPSV